MLVMSSHHQVHRHLPHLHLLHQAVHQVIMTINYYISYKHAVVVTRQLDGTLCDEDQFFCKRVPSHGKQPRKKGTNILMISFKYGGLLNLDQLKYAQVVT